MPSTFTYNDSDFLLDGQPVQLYSGELHYFRTPAEYWPDRFAKARAMGLNAVCTYMAWNLHEPRPGEWDFSGMLDVAAFVREAQKHGLHVLLRPGPYICAEWDFGGLPPWLLENPDLRLRCNEPAYLDPAVRFLKRVGEELAGLTITRGGPILMVQVENEYGSYGNDRAYLNAMKQATLDAGFDDVPLFTSDGSERRMLRAGRIDGCLATANFGSGAEKNLGLLRSEMPTGPLMNGEFWCGWFDHWGTNRQGSASTDSAKDLAWMVENNASFNIYMFHGGTNFGLAAGANMYDDYTPTVTGYDYWAVLDEAGRPTAKFHAYRDVLAKRLPPGESLPDLPPPVKIIKIPEFELSESAALFDNLPDPIEAAQPRPMEMYGQSGGMILYRTDMRDLGESTLKLVDLHDYARLWLNGEPLCTLDRRLRQSEVKLDAGYGKAALLDILVDGMGRVNYGPKMIDLKGITQRVEFANLTVMNWQVYPLPMDAPYLASLKYGTADQPGPAFHRGTFELSELGDTFLDLRNYGKGHVWLNGHPLGRYWHIGPQQTLYVPAPFLKIGSNEVVVFDLLGKGRKPLAGLSEPVLDEVRLPK